MAAYTVRILKAASRELEKLDKSAGRRVIDRIRWLAENAGEAKLQALKGDLSGLYKLREGDYRIIYEIIRKENVILVHSIGHRREVYQRRK